MVAAAVRTILAQPDAQPVQAQYDDVQTMLARSHPKVAAMLDQAREDPLAFAAFPSAHRKKMWSTNPERLNREVKRRTDVVGVFSDLCCAWPEPSRADWSIAIVRCVPS